MDGPLWAQPSPPDWSDSLELSDVLLEEIRESGLMVTEARHPAGTNMLIGANVIVIGYGQAGSGIFHGTIAENRCRVWLEVFGNS